MVPRMFSGQRLLQLEKALQKHIIGQSEAIGAVSRVIRRAEIGLEDTNGPIGSFLFAGPLGVGKNLLAKSLAIEYFGSKESIITLNMNQYSYNDSVSKLLTETVQNRPHSVILMQDIHEAPTRVLIEMIQVLRDGRLTDNKGLTVSFNKNIIVMTSSMGQDMFQGCGERSLGVEECKDYLRKELQIDFDSEFFESIDEVVVFKQLSTSELKEIVETVVNEVIEKLIKTMNIKLTVTDKFKEKLVNDVYGDHNCWNKVICLKKAFRRILVDNITMGILNGNVKEGAVTVDIDSFGNLICFYSP